MHNEKPHPWVGPGHHSVIATNTHHKQGLLGLSVTFSVSKNSAVRIFNRLLKNSAKAAIRLCASLADAHICLNIPRLPHRRTPCPAN